MSTSAPGVGSNRWFHSVWGRLAESAPSKKGQTAWARKLKASSEKGEADQAKSESGMPAIAVDELN